MIFSNTKRTQKRSKHHIFIALASFCLTGLFYVILLQFYPDPQRWIFRYSLATAYVAAILLATTLTLGAWNILRGRVNPVSSDLRRDAGIWCALFSLAHVAFGLNVHLQSWKQYFVDNTGTLLTDAFGFANYLGVIATLVILALLATSNDFSLKYFGRDRWKAIQRWNYILIVFTVLHGILYQIVEKRLIPFAFIFGAIALWIMMIQLAGFQKRRREMRTNSPAR